MWKLDPNTTKRMRGFVAVFLALLLLYEAFLEG